jgi:hypothetical protein
MSIFYFDLSLKLPKGGASHFRGGAKMLRGGAKQSQGRCGAPLKIRPWFEWSPVPFSTPPLQVFCTCLMFVSFL